jgi:hypothetical protein
MPPIVVLSLCEDLFECCPESQLKTLFPILEEVLHGRPGHAKKIHFSEENVHQCTKICRLMMSKLTVTHDLQFRGTLLRFLARTLPLTHKSGKTHDHPSATRQLSLHQRSTL